jgi:hypothetical protein
MRFEEALLSLTRNSQMRFKEQQRSQRAKNGRKKKSTKACCFIQAEVEPHSSDVETESSGKGIWYPEEFDRDI